MRTGPFAYPSGTLTAVPDASLETLPSAALTEAPILAHVVRGGFVESVHRGTVVVTAPDGTVEWAVGDPTGAVFARSANKPIQASAMVRAGLDLPDAELALACASHSGEPFHREAATRILAGAGLTEADLQNTPDYPIDEDERDRVDPGRPGQVLARPELLRQARGHARDLRRQRVGHRRIPATRSTRCSARSPTPSSS